MTPEEFRALITTLHGAPHGAQTAAADLLGYQPRAIRDMLVRPGPIPEPAARLLRLLADAHARGTLPDAVRIMRADTTPAP